MARTSEETPAPLSGRQRILRESRILLLVPVLLYLLACLLSSHPDDPGWSHSASITGALHNFGGLTGAYLADIMLSLIGIAA